MLGETAWLIWFSSLPSVSTRAFNAPHASNCRFTLSLAALARRRWCGGCFCRLGQSLTPTRGLGSSGASCNGEHGEHGHSHGSPRSDTSILDSHTSPLRRVSDGEAAARCVCCHLPTLHVCYCFVPAQRRVHSSPARVSCFNLSPCTLL